MIGILSLGFVLIAPCLSMVCSQKLCSRLGNEVLPEILNILIQSARTTKFGVGRPVAACWCVLLLACLDILLRKRNLSNECSEKCCRLRVKDCSENKQMKSRLELAT